MNPLMTPEHPLGDNFIDSLAGSSGINTRLAVDRLDWDGSHSMQFSLTRHLLVQYSEIDVEVSVVGQDERGWPAVGAKQIKSRLTTSKQ